MQRIYAEVLLTTEGEGGNRSQSIRGKSHDGSWAATRQLRRLYRYKKREWIEKRGELKKERRTTPRNAGQERNILHLEDRLGDRSERGNPNCAHLAQDRLGQVYLYQRFTLRVGFQSVRDSIQYCSYRPAQLAQQYSTGGVTSHAAKR